MFMTFGWGAMLMGYILGYTCQSIAQPVFGVPSWVLVIVLCAIVIAYSSLGGSTAWPMPASFSSASIRWRSWSACPW